MYIPSCHLWALDQEKYHGQQNMVYSVLSPQHHLILGFLLYSRSINPLMKGMPIPFSLPPGSRSPCTDAEALEALKKAVWRHCTLTCLMYICVQYSTYGNSASKRMIWGYPYFRTSPSKNFAHAYMKMPKSLTIDQLPKHHSGSEPTTSTVTKLHVVHKQRRRFLS